jgi:glutamate-5-semialdehyde dehydrogenase
METTIVNMAKAARAAATQMAKCGSNQKNAVLLGMADKIEKDASTIKKANQKDLARAKEMGLSPAMIDRLTVSDATIGAMANGLRVTTNTTIFRVINVLNYTDVTMRASFDAA